MVSHVYLEKIKRAVRIKASSADIVLELTDIIEECRADLEGLGVSSIRASDETDSLILGAVRCFARWKMAADNAEGAANREDYMLMRDEIRRKSKYTEVMSGADD